MSGLRHYTKTLAVSVGGSLLVYDHVASISRVDGDSMRPCLNPELIDSNNRPYIAQDWVLLNKWSTMAYQVERGDIVSLR